MMSSNKSWELSHPDIYLSAGDVGHACHLPEEPREMACAAHVAEVHLCMSLRRLKVAVTPQSTSGKGALHTVQDRYFYFQCWFCLYSLGGSRNPTKTSLPKEHFVCGRNMEFPKVRTAGSSDCISIKQLALFTVPHLLLCSLACLQAEGSCGSCGSGPALELSACLPGAVPVCRVSLCT